MQNIKELLEKQKIRRLAVIFPHPDDESVAAYGLLHLAKKLNIKTTVVILTKGDAGKNFTPGTGKTLTQIRVKELKSAIKKLGIPKLYLGSYPDGKLKSTKQEWTTWIKGILVSEKPDLVLTYDHSGVTGHPDHIILSLELKALLARDFKDTKLFWVSFPKVIIKQMNSKTKQYYVSPTHFTKINPLAKLSTILEHKSQGFIQRPKILLFFIQLLFVHRTEWYHEVDMQKKYPYKYVQFDI